MEEEDGAHTPVSPALPAARHRSLPLGSPVPLPATGPPVVAAFLVLAVGGAPATSDYLVKFAAARDPSGCLAPQTGTHGAPKVLLLQAPRLSLLFHRNKNHSGRGVKKRGPRIVLDFQGP